MFLHLFTTIIEFQDHSNWRLKFKKIIIRQDDTTRLYFYSLIDKKLNSNWRKYDKFYLRRLWYFCAARLMTFWMRIPFLKITFIFDRFILKPFILWNRLWVVVLLSTNNTLQCCDIWSCKILLWHLSLLKQKNQMQRCRFAELRNDNNA